MNVLVTGCEGSLMQAVIPRLLAQGLAVRGVDNFHRTGRIARRRKYEFIEGDLVDPDLVRSAVRGVDFILQGAARIYGIGGFHRFPADILAHDLTLHQNLLWAAQRGGVQKVCYVSSSMVYERCEHHPSRESDAFDARVPATDYGLSKLVGERMCLAFERQYGLRYVIWRPFNIITPLEKAEQEQGLSHVFADLIHAIVLEPQDPVPLIGDGRQVRCFTWIEDVAEAIARHSFVAQTDNQVYNLGNPEPVTILDLAGLIFERARSMGLLPATAALPGFRCAGEYVDDVRVRIPDVSKAAAELGWRPTVTVKEAVRRCLQNVREQRPLHAQPA